MRDVHFYFGRALRRHPHPLDGEAGEREQDDEGNSAQISLIVSCGVITDVLYRCTTCCTLVALCEHLNELLQGKGLNAVDGYTADALLALHPEIPVSRRGRAELAVRALRAAMKTRSEGVLS